MFWGKTRYSNEYSSCLTAGLHGHGLMFRPKRQCQVFSPKISCVIYLAIHQRFTFTKTLPQHWSWNGNCTLVACPA